MYRFADRFPLGELNRHRFDGLPRGLRIVGWVGVAAAFSMLAALLWFVPALMLYTYGGHEWAFGLFGLLDAFGLLAGLAAHLLVHNPFRKAPFVPPWTPRTMRFERVLWVISTSCYALLIGLILVAFIEVLMLGISPVRNSLIGHVGILNGISWGFHHAQPVAFGMLLYFLGYYYGVHLFKNAGESVTPHQVTPVA